MCTANLDIAPGKSIYTLMLNPKGGIEADFVVSRMADGSFYLTVASAVTKYVLRRLESRTTSVKDVEIRDITDDLGIIAVQGPGSKSLLESVLNQDLDDLQFSTHSRNGLNCDPVVDMDVFRLAYVGELGWEVYLSSDMAAHGFEALMAAAGDDAKLCGLHAKKRKCCL